MSATNLTKNLKLPQFVASDKPSWLGDVNGAMLNIDNGIGTIKSDITKANDTASSAKSQSDANTVTLGNVNTELESIGNRVTALEAGGGTEQLEQKVKTNTDDIEALQTRADTFEEEIADNGSKISANTKSITELTPRVKSCEDNITSLQTTSETLLGSTASLATKLDTTTNTASDALSTAKRAEQSGITNTNNILSINSNLSSKTDLRLNSNALNDGGLNCAYSKSSKIGIVFGGILPSLTSFTVTSVETKLCDVNFNASGIDFSGNTLVSSPVIINGITFTLTGTLRNAYITVKHDSSITDWTLNGLSPIPSIIFVTT